MRALAPAPSVLNINVIAACPLVPASTGLSSEACEQEAESGRQRVPALGGTLCPEPPGPMPSVQLSAQLTPR